MAYTLYDATVAQHIRMLNSFMGLMQKAKAHCAESGADVDGIANLKICDDMLPFSFQINSIRHHSKHAIEGVWAGEFSPPKALEATDFASLEAVITESIAALKDVSAEELNAVADKDVLFKAGSLEVPFTAAGFLTSLSLPNFYFHVTTAYNLLRQAGVKIGKLDYMKELDIKS